MTDRKRKYTVRRTIVPPLKTNAEGNLRLGPITWSEEKMANPYQGWRGLAYAIDGFNHRHFRRSIWWHGPMNWFCAWWDKQMWKEFEI